jgi:hypothetical protein
LSEIPKEATYGSIETTRGTKLHTTKPPREKAFLVGAKHCVLSSKDDTYA